MAEIKNYLDYGVKFIWKFYKYFDCFGNNRNVDGRLL